MVFNYQPLLILNRLKKLGKQASRTGFIHRLQNRNIKTYPAQPDRQMCSQILRTLFYLTCTVYMSSVLLGD